MCFFRSSPDIDNSSTPSLLRYADVDATRHVRPKIGFGSVLVPRFHADVDFFGRQLLRTPEQVMHESCDTLQSELPSPILFRNEERHRDGESDDFAQGGYWCQIWDLWTIIKFFWELHVDKPGRVFV